MNLEELKKGAIALCDKENLSHLAKRSENEHIGEVTDSYVKGFKEDLIKVLDFEGRPWNDKSEKELKELYEPDLTDLTDAEKTVTLYMAWL